MDEVVGALIVIALVLCAVFLPTAFISGLQGTCYKQFAITIAASTMISAFVSLTLSPALAAVLLKPHHDQPKVARLRRLSAPIRWLFTKFNSILAALSESYGWLTRRLIRIAFIVLVIYGGGDLRRQLARFNDAFVIVLEPPSVPGIGTGGGLKGYVQNRPGQSLAELERVTWLMAGTASQTPGFTQAFTLFNTHTPQIYADVDRTKSELLGVPINRVFEALSIYMGSTF